MKYISEEDLRAHLINDGCDDGCGYLDERDISSLPWIELDATDDDVLDKIRAEIDAHRKTIKDMADTDDWYAGKLSGHDCDIEIIDKYKEGVTNGNS